MAQNKTEEIDIIVNHPKKAINKLALPIIISNLFMTLNNIIDGIWVAGLGPESLAAVGFVTPLFFAFVGISNGLGAGSNSLIARCIGAEKYHDAGNSAIHSIMLCFIATAISTVVILIILKPLLLMMGAGEVIDYALSYGYIVLGGVFSLFIPAMLAAIFRSQGEIERASYPLMLTAIINMILDPIFIYVIGWGITGAAIATVLAATLAMLPMIYWMFYKKDSFLEIRLSEYKRDLSIYKDILVVGIPASLEQFILSFVSILMNYWLTLLSGTVAVAAYTATWRLISIGISPLIGIGVAALTVGGAAYGARNLDNLKTALNYGVKLGLISSVIICSFFFIFAEPLSFIFSYSASSAVLSDRVVEALRILCFFILFMPLGILAGNIFQSMGKGTISLILTILRTFILEVLFAGLFAFVFNLADIGIYMGIVCGMALGSICGYVYINYYLRKHKSYFK
ncbi:MAG: MATE family efflux transporter [Methanobrevibacter sp.]|uniref:MATE family efflux transporter n=1 Tax=Methanobrevibacter sp. TaxID=66852 RepID=UPI0025F47523|nr:MATE family efflux transporter [Methanobrevibacter sp.]MBR3113814.1 MATE family efflux transporter [Methanobrevibacter sp.]MBR6993459.1 MATE family efflux transporter [Methanobrevibacter sp.]